MDVTVGTFNLNNLFSRFNFRAQIDAVHKGEAEVEVTAAYTFDDEDSFEIRSYQGRLVTAKSAAERAVIAARIKAIDVDVLAVQEVEDIDTLKRFAHTELGGLYPHVVLIEGNDPRLIDIGLLSKFPLGAVTSWQHATYKNDGGRPIFGRDLLQVEVLDKPNGKVLFTVFNNHLKSQFVALGDDPTQHPIRRRKQAEKIAEIVASRMRPSSRYVIVGDMNDTPDSHPLAPFAASSLGLVNGLADPTETRPAKPDNPPPPSKSWTHRFKESGQPAAYELFDQVWLSPALASKQTGAFIDRRTKHSGDGSDHDPAWVRLSL
ncbi:MAG: endonuclease/exonuclease/phosphatase family protein [Dehalococcoidia bacterium]